jgi:hypothetical protein
MRYNDMIIEESAMIATNVNVKLPAMRFLLVCAAGALLGSCYASRGPQDTYTDVHHDVTGDVADIQPDVPPDVTPDVPPDIPPDRPPDLPPFNGVTFVVENDSSMPWYVSAWGYYGGPENVQYDFTLLPSSGEDLYEMYVPWCTVECGTFTDPDMCCMDCAPPPWIDTVRLLLPGQSFRTWWDGTLYEMSTETCPCGCYESFQAPYDLYYVEICGSPDIVCFGPGSCAPDANGFIQGAALSDTIGCVGQEFSVPGISGGVVTLRF